MQRPLLIATRRQPHRTPPRRGRTVAHRLELHCGAQRKASWLQHARAADDRVQDLGGVLLPGIEGGFPGLPEIHRRLRGLEASVAEASHFRGFGEIRVDFVALTGRAGDLTKALEEVADLTH